MKPHTLSYILLRRGAAIALLLGMGSVADDAVGCSVCFSALEKTREAYYLTTVLLGILPFLMLGGFGLWLRRATRTQRSLAVAHGAEGATSQKEGEKGKLENRETRAFGHSM